VVPLLEKNYTVVPPYTKQSKEFDDMCIRFDTIPECDRQTDRQICHNNIALCVHMHADAR